MQADLSIWHLLSEASLLVQLVLALLLLMSLASWTVIFKKNAQLKAALKQADQLELDFSRYETLNQLADRWPNEQDNGLSHCLSSPIAEYNRLKSRGHSTQTIIAGAERAMRMAFSREVNVLEANLSFLATVGSISPYIGLFGTVWGIMSSFQALAGMRSVSLSTIAPGIAEALFATAMGLFVAIPAVIAYNRFSNEVEHLINQYHRFMEELSIVLQCQQSE